jgi:pimeloyl-ACP methyl ester carboxylesterase
MPSPPVRPPNPTYPNVPTLVMSGDLDTTVPTDEVRKVASLFPESTVVLVAEAGHETIVWTQCAAALQSQFFRSEIPLAQRLRRRSGPQSDDFPS